MQTRVKSAGAHVAGVNLPRRHPADTRPVRPEPRLAFGVQCCQFCFPGLASGLVTNQQ